MATNPLYTIGDVVYLKESAALGFLETFRICGVHLGPNGWLYTINVSMSPPSVGGYFERRSQVGTQILSYTEDEFVSFHDALVLVKANTAAAYDRAKAQLRLHFPDEPTSE